eukprot:545744-Pleurochrysis_carterae.AAC.1
MAIPEKRQAGTSVLWLGVVFVTIRGRGGSAFPPARQGPDGPQSGAAHPVHPSAHCGHGGLAEALRPA